MIRQHLRANAVAYFALGGTSYAAMKPGPRTVGTPQLKAGAVTNAKVKPGTLQLDRLAQAARDELGLEAKVVRNPQDPPSCPGGGCTGTTPAGTTKVDTARCPAGYFVISGGFSTSSAPEEVTSSGPTPTGDGWTIVFALAEDAASGPHGAAVAVCVR